METTRVRRRQVLTGTGAGALSLAALAMPGRALASDSRQGHDGLEGGWLITRKDTGAATTVAAVATFAAGGALATADINPPAPATLGAWTRSGEHHFKATFWTGDVGQSQSQAPTR